MLDQIDTPMDILYSKGVPNSDISKHVTNAHQEKPYQGADIGKPLSKSFHQNISDETQAYGNG